MKQFKIEQENANLRLDKAIANEYPDLSRTNIQRLIEENKVWVNKKNQKASYKVSIEDKIEIEEVEAQEIELKPQDIPLDIVYEDNDIIVVNKQKGLVVHPANGNQDGTLVNGIMAICKDTLSGIGGKIRPGIVHRLDKDTSGLIIIAKNDKAHINLSEQIKNREVKKTYLALVRGVIKRYNNYTFLEVKIETGRTHQIRVHMSQIGYPIVGDMVYSNGRNPFAVEGQMLHAAKLSFKHPITNKELNLETPLPKYFLDILDKLDNDIKIM